MTPQPPGTQRSTRSIPAAATPAWSPASPNASTAPIAPAPPASSPEAARWRGPRQEVRGEGVAVDALEMHLRQRRAVRSRGDGDDVGPPAGRGAGLRRAREPGQALARVLEDPPPARQAHRDGGAERSRLHGARQGTEPPEEHVDVAQLGERRGKCEVLRAAHGDCRTPRAPDPKARTAPDARTVWMRPSRKAKDSPSVAPTSDSRVPSESVPRREPPNA
jgi:hypothetical protein